MTLDELIARLAAVEAKLARAEKVIQAARPLLGRFANGAYHLRASNDEIERFLCALAEYGDPE